MHKINCNHWHYRENTNCGSPTWHEAHSQECKGQSYSSLRKFPGLAKGVMNHVKVKCSGNWRQILSLKNCTALHTHLALHTSSTRGSLTAAAWTKVLSCGACWIQGEKKKSVCTSRFLLMLGSITVEKVLCHWLNRLDCLLWKSMGLSYPKGKHCSVSKQKREPPYFFCAM